MKVTVRAFPFPLQMQKRISFDPFSVGGFVRERKGEVNNARACRRNGSIGRDLMGLVLLLLLPSARIVYILQARTGWIINKMTVLHVPRYQLQRD